MSRRRRIYHITHVDNLAGIVEAGGLFSDAARLEGDCDAHEIGMSNIKTRRLNLPVRSCPGTYVGEYVPFYFCPRSIMLYVIHRANHEELTYRGGQHPIVHLTAPLSAVLPWVERERRRWAFSESNAGANYTRFSASPDELDELDWRAIAATDFRDSVVKEAKQAEFLVHEFFPLALIDRIGVFDQAIAARAHNALSASDARPSVRVQKSWYY